MADSFGWPLTEIEKSILLSLIFEGSDNRYSLSKKTGYSYASIFSYVKSLMEQGFITVSGTRQGRRNPKVKVEIYSLTPLGLIAGFTLFSEAEWERIDEAAERNGEKLPLVLGKWDYFKANGLKDLALERLKHAAKFNIRLMYGWPLKPEKRVVSFLTEGFHDPLYDPAGFRTEYKAGVEEEVWESRRRWIQGLMGDLDLKSYAVERLINLTGLLQQKIAEKRKELDFLKTFIIAI